ARHLDLTRLVLEAIIGREFSRDRLAKLENALDRSVFRLAALKGCDRRVLDVLRRIEVGLARPESANVEALCFEGSRLRRDREGRRRRNSVQASGKPDCRWGAVNAGSHLTPT